MFLDWVYNNDPWLVIAAFVVVALVVSTTGLFLVYRLVDRDLRKKHGDLADFTVTNMAVLYAVLLAFIAVATWESFAKANEVVQTEANLAGNLSRDTRGFPQPAAGVIRSQIHDYLRVVVDKEWPAQRTGKVPTEGWVNLNRIHEEVASVSPSNEGQAVLMQEMLRGLNELYSARTSRLDAVEGHIPPMVWFVIIALGALTIGYTCLVNAELFLTHWMMLAGLVTALTLVVALIVELDFPFRGAISVSAAAYEHVLQQLALTGS